LQGGLTVVVLGSDGEPTSTLAADLRRLNYRPHVLRWPGPPLEWTGPRPVTVMVDFRAVGVDARGACTAARQSHRLRTVPVVAVIHEQEAPRIDLSLGFDDLLLSPYRLSDLAARLRLADRRMQESSTADVLRAGALALNQRTYEVSLNRTPVELTLKEYQLLRFLMRYPGRVFSRAELLRHVWGDDYFGGTRTVDVHVRRLRAKTEAAGELIQTVRGVGYRLAPSQ
jgi:DNA-binding response OmpR family regulator